MKTTQIIKFLTILSSSLAALLGGLATLPVPSADLPIPPSWRPYLVSVAFIAAAIRIVVLPVIENVIKGLKETPVPLWVLCGAATCLLSSCLLQSCTEYPFRGRISYIDENTDSKAGLVFAPGAAPSASLRLPIKDANGNRLGSIDIQSGK